VVVVRPDLTVHIPVSSHRLCSATGAERCSRGTGGCSISISRSQPAARQDPAGSCCSGIHDLHGFEQGRCPDAWSCPGGIFLCGTWARLLNSGENNHTRFPQLPGGSDGKFLLCLPRETYPAAASSLREFEQGSLYLCNRWCCNRKSTL